MKKQFILIDDITPDIARRFYDETCRLKPGDSLEFVITSYGGDVFASVSMVNRINELRSLGVYTTSFIYALAASSAALVALSCDRVEMSLNSYIMIHSAWGCDEKGVEICNELQKKILSKRFKQGVDLSKELWYDAKEALALGLCDCIFDSVQVQKEFGDVRRIAAQYTFKKHTCQKEAVMSKQKAAVEEKEEKTIETKDGKVVEVKKEVEVKKSVDDVLERLVEKIEEIEKRLVLIESGGVFAECGNSEKDKMTALYNRISAKDTILAPQIPKTLNTESTLTQADLEKQLDRFRGIFGESFNYDSKAAKIF